MSWVLVQVACQLLHHSEGRKEQADQVMRAVAAAAQAALAVNAATTATMAQALVAAEESAAGMHEGPCKGCAKFQYVCRWALLMARLLAFCTVVTSGSRKLLHSMQQLTDCSTEGGPLAN